MRDAQADVALTAPAFHGPPLALPSPVLTAAGCFGDGTAFAREHWLRDFGGIVTRTLTPRPRRGWPAPRVYETAAGVVYATGLPNRGLDGELRHCAAAWARLPTPLIVSIAAEEPADLAELAAELDAVAGVVALELNLAWPGAAAMERESAAAVGAMVSGAAALTALPLLVKLSPEAGVVDAARAAAAAGAAALTIGHGWPAAVPLGGEARLREGALAGPAILPLTLRLVAAIVDAVPIAVVACGGVDSAAAARQCLAAGARAVQVGSALLRDPLAAARIGAELREDAALDPTRPRG